MASMTDFKVAMAADPLELEPVASVLDAMDEASRVEAIRSLSGKDQRRLWDAAEGRGATLDDFVPPGVPAGREVIHEGRNSLPAFKLFQKRFVRVEGSPKGLYGYNEGRTRPLIGPGYFVAESFPGRGEVGINYLKTPPRDAAVPDGWPAIKKNEQGLQRFVYAGMVDYMRKVSRHVSVGRAYKNGTKELPHTFMLCRLESA